RGQNSAGLAYHVQSPMTAPISLNRSAPNRQSVSGFPLSANSAFRPTGQSLNTHSASTSASINGLISPNNIDDVRSGRISSSPLPSPNPSRISMSVRNTTSNGEQPSKESFIHLFDSFYDTVADTRSLKTTLEDQIRKTTTLLQTLQASGSMIESLVRGHFREMQREVVNDLMTLEKRLSKVEERIRSSAAVVGMGPSPPLDPDRRLSDISTTCSDIGLSHNKDTSTLTQDADNSSSQYLSVSQLTNSSPPLSAVSSSSGSEESQTKDYQDILSAGVRLISTLSNNLSAIPDIISDRP
ncbi:7376_t:CDS:2, partial [Funneliformis mosseae]